MSPAQNNDPLGYVDELREAVHSRHLRFLFSPEYGVGEPIQKSIAGQSRNREPLQVLGALTPLIENINQSRWEMSAQLAQQLPEMRADALTVISTLGFCRLYGISLPSDLKTRLPTPLPVELLVPGIIEALRILEAATEDSRAIPDRFDNSESLEDRSHCTSLLHLLMELWAIFIVVDEEYQYGLRDQQSFSSPFSTWMRRLLDAYSALDGELQRDEQLRLLSVATELPLLENWRKMLAEPYRDPLPWWLDGTLEEAAARIEERVVNTDLFGKRQQDCASGAKNEQTSLISPLVASAGQSLAKNYALAAAPGGLLGDIASIIIKAAANTGRDPLGVLRDLEVDEPRLRSNPVWCLDQLAASFSTPDLKRELYQVLLKHNIRLPPSVINEMSPDQDGQNDD
jgi:hypothetical protein